MSKFAVAHPGKLGDIILSFPVIKYLSEVRYKDKCDFYTSKYCEPLRTLFEYQDCINSFNVIEDYIPQNDNCGFQPWEMEVPRKEYAAVYQLGYPCHPGRELTEFMAERVGIDLTGPNSFVHNDSFECPDPKEDGREWIAVAVGRQTYTFNYLKSALRLSEYPIVFIGAAGEVINLETQANEIWDMTGTDFLKTATILKGSKFFIGALSSQAALACSLNVPIEKTIILPDVYDDNHLKKWSSIKYVKHDYDFNPVALTHA